MDRNIVILGAGFGGLHAAMRLGAAGKKGKLAGHKTILIDKNNYHIYTPTLYEISTTSKEVANYIDLKSVNTFPIAQLLTKYPIDFIKSEVVKIDVQKGNVHLNDGRYIPYDYLIIALGSETNFLGIPGFKKRVFELKSFTDAIKIRDAVWETVGGAPQDKKVNIVIGGAGPTGVELAGEIQEWLAQLKKEGHNCQTNVSIINRPDSILPRFDKNIIRKAVRRLEKLGTEIITGEIIESVSQSDVLLKSGRTVPCDIFIWTGGIKANSLTSIFPFKTRGKEQIKVDSKLLCVPNSPDLDIKGKIYAVGDITHVHNAKTDEQVPGVARAAISQAVVVAKNIISEINGEKKRDVYKPFNYPYVIPIGGKYAIAKLGPIVISGFFGWILKGLVELNYLVSIMPKGKALKIWLKGLKIFIQNDRLG